MSTINVTPVAPAGPPTPRELWSAGDYDRLASYASAAEAARLIRFSGMRAGARVLDVGTGSGIVAIVAAQHGARATGVDPTPELLARARDNGSLAGHEAIDWRDGTAEALPFADMSFDMVLSQYAHMFSPDPDTATREMLRVLKPGGRIAFAAWTPESLAPQLMGLTFQYLSPMPGPPPASPFLWGHPEGARRYLGAQVRHLAFEHAALRLPALSPGHARKLFEESFGPTVLLVGALGHEPARLTQWRLEHDRIASDFFGDGWLRFEYLLTRAEKI